MKSVDTCIELTLCNGKHLQSARHSVVELNGEKMKEREAERNGKERSENDVNYRGGTNEDRSFV